MARGRADGQVELRERKENREGPDKSKWQTVEVNGMNIRGIEQRRL